MRNPEHLPVLFQHEVQANQALKQNVPLPPSIKLPIRVFFNKHITVSGKYPR